MASSTSWSTLTSAFAAAMHAGDVKGAKWIIRSGHAFDDDEKLNGLFSDFFEPENFDSRMRIMKHIAKRNDLQVFDPSLWGLDTEDQVVQRIMRNGEQGLSLFHLLRNCNATGCIDELHKLEFALLPFEQQKISLLLYLASRNDEIAWYAYNAKVDRDQKVQALEEKKRRDAYDKEVWDLRSAYYKKIENLRKEQGSYEQRKRELEEEEAKEKQFLQKRYKQNEE